MILYDDDTVAGKGLLIGWNYLKNPHGKHKEGNIRTNWE